MIILEELRIVRFGKLENFSFRVSDGLNVIYGDNEAGKSTIQRFIKAMLYGFPSRRRAGENLKERDRALPWGGGKAEGVLILSVDGRRLEIRRQFGKNAAGDKAEVCDSITGERLDEYNVNNIGIELLGMPSDMFEKTVWISQSGVVMGGRDDEISKRLTNLKTSGNEDISADRALGVLDAMRRSIKARDGRSAKGKIDLLEERREECRRERYSLASRILQTEDTERRLKEARTELEAVKAEVETGEESYKKSLEQEHIRSAADRVKRIDECEAKIKAVKSSREYILTESLNDAAIEKAFSLEEEIKQYDAFSETVDTSVLEEECAARQTRSGVLRGAGAAVAAAGIAAAIFCALQFGILAAVFTFIVLCATGTILILSGIRYAKECKNIRYEIEAKKQEERQSLQQKAQKREELKSELAALLKDSGAANAAELSKLHAAGLGLKERAAGLEATRTSLLGDKTYEELKQISATATEELLPAAELEAKLAADRKRWIELEKQVQELDSRMAYQTSVERLPSDIDTELAAIDVEISEQTERLCAIDIAAEAIKKLAEERRSQITPQLNERVNEIIAALTGGRYSDVRVAEDYRMRLCDEERLLDAEYFSCGTYEQLYFALRLAVSGLVCEEAPLFLDDILMSYDDKRTEAAIDFLKNRGAGQTFLFTCRGADRNYAEKIGAKIINIEGGNE